MTTDSTTPFKTCTKCGQTFPATAEYFSRDNSRKNGLRSHCKQCCNSAHQQWYKANRDNQLEQYREYHQANRDQRLEYMAEYRKNNRERMRKHRVANREYEAEYRRKYRKNNAKKIRLKTMKRRTRKRDLPDTLTSEQWQNALDYFNGCCAVCSRPLRDLFGTHTVAIDHWIPMISPDCPGTTSLNCVPLCHGQDGCNNKKHAKMPIDWLAETYSKRKAKEILERIEGYFEWVRNQQ